MFAHATEVAERHSGAVVYLFDENGSTLSVRCNKRQRCGRKKFSVILLRAFVDALTPIFFRFMSIYVVAVFGLRLMSDRYYSHSKSYLIPLDYVDVATLV